MTEIATFSGQRAQKYDTFISQWVPNYSFLQEAVAKVLLKGMPPGDVLVTGCGTGATISALLQQSPGLSITGVDPSQEMLDLAKEKLSSEASVNLFHGTADQIPSNYTFSGATLILVLHFIPDDASKLALLRSISRRLRSGARLVIADIFGTPIALPKKLEILSSLLPAHIPAEEISRRFTRIRDQFHYVPESRLHELLDEAGFRTPVRFFQSAIYGGWVTEAR